MQDERQRAIAIGHMSDPGDLKSCAQPAKTSFIKLEKTDSKIVVDR